MNEKRQLVIDLDDISDDVEVLGKLYECGSIMVQSSNPDEAKEGYRVLDMVDLMMQETENKRHLDSA
ncbi:MAG: hypothetical protein ABUK11_01235 [Mariprofundaceae bacterium]